MQEWVTLIIAKKYIFSLLLFLLKINQTFPILLCILIYTVVHQVFNFHSVNCIYWLNRHSNRWCYFLISNHTCFKTWSYYFGPFNTYSFSKDEFIPLHQPSEWWSNLPAVMWQTSKYQTENVDGSQNRRPHLGQPWSFQLKIKIFFPNSSKV